MTQYMASLIGMVDLADPTKIVIGQQQPGRGRTKVRSCCARILAN